jgi:hypothetical protein
VPGADLVVVLGCGSGLAEGVSDSVDDDEAELPAEEFAPLVELGDGVGGCFGADVGELVPDLGGGGAKLEEPVGDGPGGVLVVDVGDLLAGVQFDGGEGLDDEALAGFAFAVEVVDLPGVDEVDAVCAGEQFGPVGGPGSVEVGGEVDGLPGRGGCVRRG